MFIAVRTLHNNMGVDETIARFFVDRKVPADNAFWRKRLLYITRGNGYISIPVYYDLLFRIGLPRESLLEEKHIQFMERVMHYAIAVEFKEMSFEEQLENIIQLLLGRIKNQEFYDRLIPYLQQPVLRPQGELGMPVPALNRADVFLFILCDLHMTKEQTTKALTYWYALHTSYLLMDDIGDYEKDMEEKEENSVAELGNGRAGLDKAMQVLNNNIKLLNTINPLLCNNLEEIRATLPDLFAK
jgi:hypothetical protein